MRDIVVFDLDHVVADAAWRDPLIGGGWDAYHLASRKDMPIDRIVNAMLGLRDAGFEAWVATARPEKWRKLTTDWFVANAVAVDWLLMRPDDDFRKSPEVKADLLRPHVDRILFAVDDRDDVVAAYKTIGVLGLTYFSTMTRKWGQP